MCEVALLASVCLRLFGLNENTKEAKKKLTYIDEKNNSEKARDRPIKTDEKNNNFPREFSTPDFPDLAFEGAQTRA